MTAIEEKHLLCSLTNTNMDLWDIFNYFYQADFGGDWLSMFFRI